MRALLDVNVLIALLDRAHVHHGVATQWLGAHIESGWASSAITQLGCIRVMSQPTYPQPQPAARVAERLAAATRTDRHEYWTSRPDALNDDLIEWQRVLSSRHVTDVYLLALAVAHDGRFVTFDRHVPVAAVRGATARNLVVLD